MLLPLEVPLPLTVPLPLAVLFPPPRVPEGEGDCDVIVLVRIPLEPPEGTVVELFINPTDSETGTDVGRVDPPTLLPVADTPAGKVGEMRCPFASQQLAQQVALETEFEDCCICWAWGTARTEARRAAAADAERKAFQSILKKNEVEKTFYLYRGEVRR